MLDFIIIPYNLLCELQIPRSEYLPRKRITVMSRNLIFLNVITINVVNVKSYTEMNVYISHIQRQNLMPQNKL